MKIQGSNVFVTGGASGLGEATVRALAARGARVAIYDLPRSKGAELEKELGPSTRFLAGDVTDETQVGAALDAAIAAFGPLRGVVNCAGIGSASRTVGKNNEPFPLAAFRKTIEVNLIGTFNVIRLAAARMAGNDPDANGERGAIVNTASIAAYEGQIGQAAYSASKGGIVGMTLPIARDLAAAGIRVNTIAPGLIDTPIYGTGEGADAFKAKLGESVLFPHRLGLASEFASLALELITNNYMNAQDIRLDGGIRMPPK